MKHNYATQYNTQTQALKDRYATQIAKTNNSLEEVSSKIQDLNVKIDETLENGEWVKNVQYRMELQAMEQNLKYLENKKNRTIDSLVTYDQQMQTVLAIENDIKQLSADFIEDNKDLLVELSKAVKDYQDDEKALFDSKAEYIGMFKSPNSNLYGNSSRLRALENPYENLMNGIIELSQELESDVNE